jgi:hypothetical protein
MIVRIVLAAMIALVALFPASLIAWHPAPDLDHRISAFLQRRHIRVLRATHLDTGSMVFALSVRGCVTPVHVFWASIFLEDQAYLVSQVGPAKRKSYVYLREIWQSPDGTETGMAYGKALASNLLRLRPLVDIGSMIEIAAPKACRVIETMDWRPIWEPDPADLDLVPRRSATAAVSVPRPIG